MKKMNYTLLKHVTVILQTLSIPIGVYSGVMLATGKTSLFVLGIGIAMVFAFIQAHIWWKTMEKVPKE